MPCQRAHKQLQDAHPTFMGSADSCKIFFTPPSVSHHPVLLPHLLNTLMLTGGEGAHAAVVTVIHKVTRGVCSWLRACIFVGRASLCWSRAERCVLNSISNTVAAVLQKQQ
jgi:hypothetical protein